MAKRDAVFLRDLVRQDANGVVDLHGEAGRLLEIADRLDKLVPALKVMAEVHARLADQAAERARFAQAAVEHRNLADAMIAAAHELEQER